MYKQAYVNVMQTAMHRHSSTDQCNYLIHLCANINLLQNDKEHLYLSAVTDN